MVTLSVEDPMQLWNNNTSNKQSTEVLASTHSDKNVTILYQRISDEDRMQLHQRHAASSKSSFRKEYLLDDDRKSELWLYAVTAIAFGLLGFLIIIGK